MSMCGECVWGVGVGEEWFDMVEQVEIVECVRRNGGAELVT